MTATTCRGLIVGLLVQKPVHAMDTSRLGLVPSEVSLNPSDVDNFVELCQDTAHRSPC